MAPNLKRNQLLLQTVDLDLIQPVKAGFPPLTSEVAQQQQAPQKVINQADTGDYWNWSAENDAEINKIVDEERLSADHIVGNILRQPAAPPAATAPSNDQYWDWSHAKTESTDYWTWESTSEKQIQTAVDSDSYWSW